MIGAGLRARMTVGPPALGYALAWSALAALAVARADDAAWAAGALGAALLLDAGTRLAGHALRAPRSPGLPSVVFGVGETAGLALALALLLALPDAFRVAASAVAGLLTIGATARLAMALTLRRLAREASEADRGRLP